MKLFISSATLVAVLAAAAPSQAQTAGANSYVQTSLVGSAKGLAPVVDPNLLDPWGVSLSATSPFWVSNHLSGTSTLYNGSGAITAVVVTIPAGSASPAGSAGRPTGQVQNNLSASSPAPFLLPAPNGAAASFIFCTDDGTISAWNSGVTASTAVIVADNSPVQAVYKGLAIGTSAVGPTLYAANFRSGNIDVFNSSFTRTTLAGAFLDPVVPAGFAPFNITNLGGKLYVSYAKQDVNKYLDVAGAGNGYVAVFDLNGNLLTHLISGNLNSPWGLAIAPANWGAFGGALLVGSFGDGSLKAFSATTGTLLGSLNSASGTPVAIAGLWALVFGNGKNGGDPNTLYFSAGTPNGVSTPRGLFGSIAPPAVITAVVNAASELSGAIAPGEIVLIDGQTVGPSPSFTSAIIGATSLPLSVNPSNPANVTSVTVNGIAAPIVYAGSTGTSVQVPYEIAGASTAAIVVTVGGQVTPAFTVPVTPTAPGFFTIDLSGKNAIVAMNFDGSLNTAANPAARGSAVTLFATGEGVTLPGDMDGVIELTNGRVPVASIGVVISGVGASFKMAASYPMDISGVLQLSLTVPPNLNATGPVYVVLLVNDVPATQPTYIYVK